MRMVEEVNHFRTADMFVFFAPKKNRGWFEDRQDYSTDFATDSSVDSSTHSSKNPSKKFFQTVWDRGPARTPTQVQLELPSVIELFGRRGWPLL